MGQVLLRKGLWRVRFVSSSTGTPSWEGAEPWVRGLRKGEALLGGGRAEENPRLPRAARNRRGRRGFSSEPLKIWGNESEKPKNSCRILAPFVVGVGQRGDPRHRRPQLSL